MGGQERQAKESRVMKANTLSRLRLRSGFTALVRLGLGCMFLYSSLPKIRQPYDFLSAVYNYELVGPKLGLLVAMVLPWLELLVGICLVGGIFVSGALLVSIVMGAMFIFVIASAYAEGSILAVGALAHRSRSK